MKTLRTERLYNIPKVTQLVRGRARSSEGGKMALEPQSSEPLHFTTSWFWRASVGRELCLLCKLQTFQLSSFTWRAWGLDGAVHLSVAWASQLRCVNALLISGETAFNIWDCIKYNLERAQGKAAYQNWRFLKVSVGKRKSDRMAIRISKLKEKTNLLFFPSS